MKYLENFEWRYATKRMNGQKIPSEKLNNILKAIQLAPTSLGLQPLKILVIESQEGKEKLSEACKQPQVLESSAMLVFCAWDKVTNEHIDKYIENISKTRNQEISSLENFKNMIIGFTSSMDENNLQNWTSRQAYITLGFGLATAALENVDATPMEGFNATILDEVFQLKEKSLKSVVLMSLGYRDEEKDHLAKAQKVRRQQSELFERM